MQVEVEFSRRQVAPAAAATKAGSTVDSTATAVEGAGGHPTPPGTARSPRATPVTSNSASTATAAATEEAEQRAVKLERALAAAEEARIAVEGTVQEAEDRLAVVSAAGGCSSARGGGSGGALRGEGGGRVESHFGCWPSLTNSSYQSEDGQSRGDTARMFI